MRQNISLLFFLLLPLICHAQDKPLITFDDVMKKEYHLLYGQVLDNVTRKPMIDVKAQLLTKDSVLVFEWVVNANMSIAGLYPVYFLAIPEAGEYILRMSKDKYLTVTRPYKVDKLRKSEKGILVEPILMKRAPRVTALDEVAVKATKVKFYVRGDTIVYNADAFQLEEGSMLDALIRQLPGVELKDDGRILVNGKPVESLLLNGEDFFRKDRSIMLENLPTYMVKDIRVYEDMGKTGKLVGRSVGDEQLVMDVKLKKEYQIGWLGNVEAGGGTDNRYMARLFALRFTTHSRLSAFANVNNLNDNQRPGENREWMPAVADGMKTTQNGGVNYLVDDRMHRYKLEGEATVNHTDTRTKEVTSSQSFLQDGDTYGHRRNTGNAHDLNFFTYHTWNFYSKWVNVTASPQVYYSSSSGNSLDRSLRSVADNLSDASIDTLFATDVPPAKLAGIINRVSNASKRDGHHISAGMNAQAAVKLPHTVDNILVEARGYYVNSQYDNFAHKLYDYPLGGTPTDMRNEYGREDYRNYSAAVKASYLCWQLGHNWLFKPSYEYAMDNSRRNYGLYRLDYLTEGSGTWPELGVLPSVTGWMADTYDPERSKYTTHSNDYHVVTLNLRKGEYKRNFLTVDASLPLSIDRNRLDYNRPALADTTIIKNYVFFRPSLEVRKRWYREAEDGRTLSFHELRMNYRMSMTPASIDYFVDVRTNDNPLYVYTGNNRLRVTHGHQWGVNYSWNNSDEQRTFSAGANYQLTSDAVAMGYTYDRQTGVYTYRPENVDGNRTALGNVTFSTPLDKKKRLTLWLNTNATYHRNMDLSSESADVAPQKSAVNTTYLTQRLNLNYTVGRVRMGGKASVTYTHQTSPRLNFVSTDAASFHYGVNCVADMPKGWQVSTDATMYSRRGYGDESFNTDNFVWNARVSKKLMQGRLTLMLDGFDILNNISNVRQTMNAQGRTETWYMSLPRYAMLHAVYRFSISPKKKQ